MSGGSHGYLHHYDAQDLIAERQEELEGISIRLRELGFDDAAKESESILSDIQSFLSKTNDRICKIREVWKSIDMYDSCDWGIEDVKEAIEEYRNEQDR